jgi:hypothetical protein
VPTGKFKICVENKKERKKETTATFHCRILLDALKKEI